MLCREKWFNLRAFTTDAASELNILGHDSDTFAMDGAQIGVFKQGDEVSFGSFLKGKDGSALKTQIALEILGNLTNQALEGEFANQKFSRFLVFTDFTKSDSPRAVTVRLLDTTSGRAQKGSGSVLTGQGQ